MASVKRRETNRGPRYDVRYRTPVGEARIRTFRTRKDADRFANTVEADKLRGSWVDPRDGRVTLKAYGTEWLKQRSNLRTRTRDGYAAQLERHINPSLGATELSKLTPSAIRSWHADILASGLAENTVAKTYRLLRSILTTAVTDELIVRNPCRIDGAGIERTAERPTATIIQVLDLADAVVERFRALVLLAGFTGLRLGELLGLRRRHVNLLHRTLTVEQQEQELRDGCLAIGPPKTEAGARTIALSDDIVAALEAHLSTFSGPGPEGRVFTGPHGGALRRRVWQRHWKAARTQVGLPENFRFHDLRHTANTLAAGTGASTRELMYRMGHASPAAALRYQHATRERDTAIADALGDLIAAAQLEPRAVVEQLGG